MKSCIVKSHHAGIFSMINKVITCMDIYDHVHVDWSQGCLYGKPEDGNVWNHLFEPTAPPDGEFDTVIEYPDQWLTYINPAKLYKGEGDPDWRERCHDHFWNGCRPLKEHRKSAATFTSDNHLPELAVMVRSEHHGGEQISGKSPSLDQYAIAIEAHLKPGEKLFLMAADKATLAWFQERFPVVFYPETIRCVSREFDRHLIEPQTIQDAKNCLIEVLIASMCDTLIHPISNMATACLFINPGLKSVYLE